MPHRLQGDGLDERDVGAQQVRICSVLTPAIMLTTIWSDLTRRLVRTSCACSVRMPSITTSQPSTTSWLVAHTRADGKRRANSPATSAPRGDSRISGVSSTPSHSPSTTALAISPTPMNPISFTAFSLVFRWSLRLDHAPSVLSRSAQSRCTDREMFYWGAQGPRAPSSARCRGME